VHALFAPFFAAGVGVLGAEYLAMEEAVHEYAAKMYDFHRPVREGKAYGLTRAEANRRYMESQTFDVHFKDLERTFVQDDATQIAIILAPETEVDHPTGFMFRMKTGQGKDEVSPPLYLAKVKTVKRVAASSTAGRKTPAQRLVSWEYFAPQRWTTPQRRVIAQVKATDPTSWRLDTKNSQEDQAFHRSEMICIWESQTSERQLFPKAQYEHVVRVLNARQTAQEDVGKRKRAKERCEEMAESTADEGASSDAD
jgi:hypothetical protein